MKVTLEWAGPVIEKKKKKKKKKWTGSILTHNPHGLGPGQTRSGLGLSKWAWPTGPARPNPVNGVGWAII